MSFGRTNSLSVIGVTQLDLAISLRSFARDSIPKQKYGCEKQVYPQKGVGDICFIGESLYFFQGFSAQVGELPIASMYGIYLHLP